MIKSILAAAILARRGHGGARLHTEPGHLAQGRRHERPHSGQEQGIQEWRIQGGKWHHGKGHGHRYADSHRYKYAPKGWRHYNYRPYRWEHRGCVIVGPLWYCP